MIKLTIYISPTYFNIRNFLFAIKEEKNRLPLFLSVMARIRCQFQNMFPKQICLGPKKTTRQTNP